MTTADQLDYEAEEAAAEIYAENAWLRYAERPDEDADRQLAEEANDFGLQLLRDDDAMARSWDQHFRWVDGCDWEWGS